MIISYGAQNINGINTVIDYCLKGNEEGGRRRKKSWRRMGEGLSLYRQGLLTFRATVIL